MTNRKTLTGFQLKYIALGAMLLDHIHYFLSTQVRFPYGLLKWGE